MATRVTSQLAANDENRVLDGKRLAGKNASAAIAPELGAMKLRSGHVVPPPRRAFGTLTNNMGSKAAAGGKIEKKAEPARQRAAPAAKVPGRVSVVVPKPQPATKSVQTTSAVSTITVKSEVEEVIPGDVDIEEPRHVHTMTAELTAVSEEASVLSTVTAMNAAAAAAAAISVSAKREAWWDIDAADKTNPLAETAYVADIYNFYRRTEAEGMVAPDYMNRQSDINGTMRAILVDWLIEVHLKFKLMPETLFLATSVIDRYLAVTPVPRRSLQLVGITAMLIASKYEEIWAPEVGDFVYICDNAYTRQDVLKMEKDMLNTLKFKLTIPTAYVFTARFLKAATAAANAAAAAGAGADNAVTVGADARVHALAWYLLELTLPEHSMIKFSPSHAAAASVYAALLTAHHANKTATGAGSAGAGEVWGPGMAWLTGYDEAALWPCVAQLVALHGKAGTGNLAAVHKKYSRKQFEEVAKIPAIPQLPENPPRAAHKLTKSTSCLSTANSSVPAVSRK
ncbi:hypothetical protein CLOM_g39 [Closterium sp. NIES-68]|nr:hypothetical protein CLOM_g39 [Closterium sp. NIES-68]GJP73547.1 hypothetical protein CLOP_g4247 [Closterium sp. NIES-67]